MITRSGSTIRSMIRALRVLGAPLEHEIERLDDLLHGLMEFRFAWVLALEVGEEGASVG